MEPRKKKGIASLISGVLFVGVGIVLLSATATPEWVPLAMQVVGAVASIFGFVIVFPDHS